MRRPLPTLALRIVVSVSRHAQTIPRLDCLQTNTSIHFSKRQCVEAEKNVKCTGFREIYFATLSGRASLIIPEFECYNGRRIEPEIMALAYLQVSSGGTSVKGDWACMLILLLMYVGFGYLMLLLLRLDFRGSQLAITALILAPGFWASWLLLEFAADTRGPIEGRDKLYLLVEESSQSDVLEIGIFSAPLLIAWWFIKRTPQASLRRKGDRARVPSIWIPLCAIFCVLLTISSYFETYVTLEQAVISNDLELTRRRLEFNLLLRGPNDGGIGALYSSGGLRPYPLLPIAVWHDNREMVDLLLAHGADLNPTDWNGSEEDIGDWNVGSGSVHRSTLDYAVMKKNRPMLDYLLEKGANPSQGVEMASYLKDRELLAYLLSKGGDPTEGMNSAVLRRDGATLEYLLQRGAEGTTALETAIMACYSRAIAYMLTYSENPDEIFSVLRERGSCIDIEALEAWYQRGCDLSEAGLEGINWER